MVGQIVLVKTQKPNALVQKVIDRSLDKYTIQNLQTAKTPSTNLTIKKQLKDYPTFTSNEFIMDANLNLDGKTMNKVSGMINLPRRQAGIPNQKFPIIVMVRGYVPAQEYFIGNGSINASLFFAKNGFITLAPDFLGYGDSDPEPTNIFEARFQTYTATLALINSVSKACAASPVKSNPFQMWDCKNIFVWGHSNGGQIALTTLEITGGTYPTVLWAPVSAPFPFSILYYSDETADKGKSLRKSLAQFEDVYDSDLYSLTNYLDKIKADIQIDQGTADDSVPVSWSDSLAKFKGLNVNYNKYQGANHEMNPLWNEVIQKDLEFYKSKLKN